MSAKRIGRMHRATALVPLALLSAAWTANLAGVGATTSVAAPTSQQDSTTPELPAGVPDEAIEAPATVTSPDAIGSTFDGGGNVNQIVSDSSTNGIPSSALAAYQRAESVINAADKSCHLSWQLVAAIGRVESNHGRFGGNRLDDQGVARPGIYGPVLDGRGATSRIADTDGGRYDDLTDGYNQKFDRAVGPMQFIPSTWSVVGVDADNDGERNPQDIDDAALGTAVYLCSGKDDLGTAAGQKAAIFRYNHSNSYVSLVRRIAAAYLEGDYTSVPNATTSAGVITEAAPPASNGPVDSAGAQNDTTLTPEPEPSPTDESTSPSEPTDNTGGNDNQGNGGNNNGNQGNNNNNGNDNSPIPGLPLPHVALPPAPPTGVKPVDDLLTLAEALLQCTLDGNFDNLLSSNDPFDQCVKAYTTTGKPAK